MVSKINCAPVGKILNQGAGVPRLCCSISAPFWVEIQESSLTSLSETNVTELINNKGNLQSTYPMAQRADQNSVWVSVL